MNFLNGKVTDINIAYIGGGSRGWAWGLMSDLGSDECLAGTVKLYDIDKDAAIANETIGNSLLNKSDLKGKWNYKACDTIKEALNGADFVIISILPATFDEMNSDVHIPEKYGIYQSVGDTTGPGGIVRALRTIPMYVEIATNIRDFCPEAWVINYTNPMTLCIKTLYEVFPQIKAFGCCHEVFGTQKILANMVKDIKGIEKVNRDEIKVNVLGINHFTWVDTATYNGEDIIPLYKELVDKNYETGIIEGDSQHWINNSFNSTQRVKFDLFKRYGIIAAAGDRHLAEFVPGNWYLKDPETVKEWCFGLTTVQWRKDDLVKRLEKSQKLVSGEIEFEMAPTGEDGVNQIKALLGFGDFITNVNIPNKGQIIGLPMENVVETNAVFSKNKVTPVFAGKMTDEVQSLVYRNAINQKITFEAAMKKDKALAFSAFANDPLMIASISDAKELFETMLKNTKEYLPGWEV